MNFAELNMKPFIELDAPRTVTMPGLPQDLQKFYERHEGVGLENPGDYPVRTCKLEELKWMGWDDLPMFRGYEPEDKGWKSLRAIRFGFGCFFDDVVYLVEGPLAPAGSIVAFGEGTPGPGGNSIDELLCCLVLARNLGDWLVRLAEDRWHDYGLANAEIENQPPERAEYLRGLFLSLNPGIDWVG